MTQVCAKAWLMALTLIAPITPFAKGDVYGLVSKSLDDTNLINAWRGCADEASRHGDVCLHIGEHGNEHFRRQDRAIRAALYRGISGFAVSVTNSDFLANNSLRAVHEKRIPVITFDSDLEEAHRHLRATYVGPNNAEFGRELGRQAMAFRPGGGTVCLMSGGRLNPNLNERLLGVRRALSGNENLPAHQRLSGENGWREAERCPWYNQDDNKAAVLQLKRTVDDEAVDVFISVGHWPVKDHVFYRNSLSARAAHIADLKKIIIIGVGELLPAQLDLMRDKLVHAYVSIDFTEMGRLSYRTLKKRATGEPVPKVIFTDNRVYRWNDPDMLNRRR